MKTASASVIIDNELGLHARPAGAFSELAARFESGVTVTRADTGRTANAKSLMGLLSLELAPGTELRIDATGDDAPAAVEALRALVASRFDEPPA